MKQYRDAVPPNASLKSSIECRQSALAVFTPKKMYTDESVRLFKLNNPQAGSDRLSKYIHNATKRWNKLPLSTKAKWVAASREHDECQPFIKDAIIESLQRNPSKSYRQVSRDIGGWCSADTIYRWLCNYASFSYYNERIVPLLTSNQRRKHVEWATKFRNHWGLSKEQREKVLLIHYDEKWFYGMVPRTHAKHCEELFLTRKDLPAYHKNYINKVMVLAITGYAFKNRIEDGGDGLKIGLIRVQGAKIAKKTVKESSRKEDGSLKFDGPVKRRAGDVYLVDTTVTGSSFGTSSEPRFSLMSCFVEVILPKIARIVGPGGPYEGYCPVIQGDNAGPHQDRNFVEGMREYCGRNGWHWEPQAPQMPYSNNLALSVFPCMSKRHTRLLSEYSNVVASTDVIYDAAEEVWRTLPSSTIAAGFPLAYRIAGRVVEEEGCNDFLRGSKFHYGVRQDFVDTDKGIRPKKK